MKVLEITFDELFPTGNFANQRYGMKVAVDPEDSIKEVYAYAKKEVEQSFKALNPDLQPSITDFNTGQSSIPIEDRGAKEKLEIDIDNATTIEQMAALRDDAIKHGLWEHWDERYTQMLP